MSKYDPNWPHTTDDCECGHGADDHEEHEKVFTQGALIAAGQSGRGLTPWPACRVCDEERKVIESLMQDIRSVKERNEARTLRAGVAGSDLDHPESIVHRARDLARDLSDRGVACPQLVAFAERQPAMHGPVAKPVLDELAMILKDGR